MSKKKHRGDHAHRARRKDTAPVAGKTRHVYIRQHVHILLTLLVVLGVLALLVCFQMLGWWDNIIGSVALVLVGAFLVMCLYDLGLLLTACLTFGDGMVNAGKNAEGQTMLFHASSVVRLEIRDPGDTPLPDDLSLYRDVDLTFVMESGRVNRRRLSRLTAKQYAAIRAALEAERHA